MNNVNELKQKAAELDKSMANMQTIMDAAKKQKAEIDALINAVASKRTPEQAFHEMMNGCVIWNNDPQNEGCTNYMKDGKFMFQQDSKNGYFWCSYERVWSVFRDEFGMKCEQWQAFVTKLLEERYNLRGLKTDF